MAKYITEKLYVSGVKADNLSLSEDFIPPVSSEINDTPEKERESEKTPSENRDFKSLILRMGEFIGKIVGIFYQSGRESVELTLKNILPFMAFVSALTGIILYTGLGNLIADIVAPLASSPVGLVALSLILTIPILSPLLGPGSVASINQRLV